MLTKKYKAKKAQIHGSTDHFERRSTMALVINTNIQALNIQGNLASATDSLNQSMKRMSTGFKINSAADDAAGSAISSQYDTTLSSSKVASQNVQIGSNLLTSTEGTLNSIKANLQRIRDLSEQSANGTYSATDRAAMLSEVQQRVLEIDRVATNNGMGAGITGAAVAIQVGTGSSADNQISLTGSIFNAATVTGLGGAAMNAAAVSTAFTTAAASKDFLDDVDVALKNVSDRKTSIGAFQNRLTSAGTNLAAQQVNIAASNSTLKDADIATESANFVKAQILQQASVSLLAQANSSPQIALKLIG